MNEPTHDKNAVDPRDVRAAKESMVVTNEAPGMARVYSGARSQYIVDIRSKTCECPAYRYHDGKCKHVRRVEMEIGDRPIPDLPGYLDVEGMMEAQGRGTVMSDGGVATNNMQASLDGRPEDCSCLPQMDSDGLGCFECFLEGFETANPNATADKDESEDGE